MEEQLHLILTLALRVFSQRHAPANSRFSLHRRLHGPQRRPGSFKEDKSFARAGNRNKIPGFSALSLFTTSTALFTILYIRVTILQTIGLFSVVALKYGVVKKG
jgi:hypothetical protein